MMQTADVSALTTLRKLAREAVIFTLLGPFLLLAVDLAYLTFSTPPPAAYTKVPQCPDQLPKNVQTCTFLGKGGFFLIHGKDEEPWVNNSLFLDGYTTDVSATHRYVWLPKDAGVGQFNLNAEDESIKVAISQDFPQAYKFKDSIFGENLLSATFAAAILGWPLGLGIWIAYRIVRFAIRG